MKNLCILSLFLILFSSPMFSQHTLVVPSERYSSIQDALNAARTGDTVLVMPGVYQSIYWPGMPGIKLIAAGDTSNTIIEGSNKGSVITISERIDTNTVIKGFKIRYGDSKVGYGGGIHIFQGSPKLINLDISENQASYGGGIYIQDGSPILDGVSIHDNDGSGIYHACMSSDYSNGSLRIYNSRIYNNTGGVFNSGGGITVRGWYTGPFSFSTKVDIRNVKVFGNKLITNVSPNGGGGIYIENANVSINNAEIYNNSVNGYYLKGGGVYLTHGTFDLKNVRIMNNSCTSMRSQWDDTQGGGIYAESFPVDTALVTTSLTNVLIYKNKAGSCGGAYIADKSSFENVTFADNTAGTEINDGSMNRVTFADNSGNILTDSLKNIFIKKGTISRSTFFQNPVSLGRIGSVKFSNFVRNKRVLHTDNLSVIDLRNNWWGDPSGAYHQKHNPSGKGDTVSINSYVVPFLTSPDTSAPLIPVMNVKAVKEQNGYISLSWSKSLLEDVKGYRIYYDTASFNGAYDEMIDAGDTSSYTIKDLVPGRTYYIAVTCYDKGGDESWYPKEINTDSLICTGVTDKSMLIPAEYLLSQNYPNPFNPSTVIKYGMPEQGHVKITIYNVLGESLAVLLDDYKNAGYHEAVWNAPDMASGIYFCAAEITDKEGRLSFRASRKMVLIK